MMPSPSALATDSLDSTSKAYVHDDYGSDEETLADMNAFNREYENDNSWEQLQEDEYGHLRPLVSALLNTISSLGHAFACVITLHTQLDASCSSPCWALSLGMLR